MTSKLLAAVAGALLAGTTSLAIAQQAPPAAAPRGGTETQRPPIPEKRGTERAPVRNEPRAEVPRGTEQPGSPRRDTVKDQRERPDRRDTATDQRERPDRRDTATDQRERPDRRDTVKDQRERPDRRDTATDQRERPDRRETTVERRDARARDVRITSEQRTRVRQTIVRSNVRRVTNVHFTVSVGTAVPASVELVPIPTTIVAVVPEYAGFYVIRVGDQLLVIDPETREIVTIIAV